VVAGGDHQDSPPVAFAGEPSDSPSFTARRRRLGDDGQDLERKTPRCQQLRSNRFTAHDNKCRRDALGVDGSAETPRPITIERNDRVGAAREVYGRHSR
jgi:hypothetical protein